MRRQQERAPIDEVSQSVGICTGDSGSRRRGFAKGNAYIPSRMVKFGPFIYPHPRVISGARHIVGSPAKSAAAHGRKSSRSCTRLRSRTTCRHRRARHGMRSRSTR